MEEGQRGKGKEKGRKRRGKKNRNGRRGSAEEKKRKIRGGRETRGKYSQRDSTFAIAMIERGGYESVPFTYS